MTTLPYSFGAGNLVGVRTDISNATPAVFGVLQDIEVDFDASPVELYGQYQFPVAVGRGKVKVTCKAKAAKINSALYNYLFFGNSSATTGGILQIMAESQNVPGSSPYTVQVTNHSTFAADLGVFYTATGIQLTPVASSPSTGQYTINTSTGTYTFASGDASAAVSINYTYTTNTGAVETAINNQLMGAAPVFQANLANTYTGFVTNLQLTQCLATKLTFPFKNTDFTINDFEFSAFANSSGVIGTLTTSQ